MSGATLTPNLLQLITVTISTPEKTLAEASAYKVNMALTLTPTPMPTPTPTPTPIPPQVYLHESATVTLGSTTSPATTLHADDSTYFTVDSTTSGIRRVDWLAEDRDRVKRITVTYNGKLSHSLAQRLYLYNWDKNSYELFRSRRVNASDVTITFFTTKAKTYISSEGKIRLRFLAQNKSQSFTAYGDYLSFTIRQ